MSESLAWEKWSTFSRNRYLEEAEEFSKSGYVAEKKAYFEAHYRKKATEKAAVLIQEANNSANGTFDLETQDGNCSNSFIEIKSNENSNVTVCEHLDKEAFDYQVVDHADTSVYKAEDATQVHIDTNLNVENSIVVDNSHQFENVEICENIIPKEERRPDPGTGGQEILASPSPVKGRKVQSSPKLSTKTRAAKLSYSLADRKASVQTRDGIIRPSKSKKSVGDAIEKNRLTARSLQTSINFPPQVDETRKIKSKSPNKRTEILLNKSVTGGVTANAKVPSLSIDCLKSSSTARSNPRSPTKLSPFRFRTEERAAKRKERMDEIKAKEVGKLQLQSRRKDKTEHDHKKLWQSSGNKPKLNEDRSGVLRSPSNHVRKIPLARPRSPRKQSSTTVQDKNFQNPWKPPISINNSKLVQDKTNKRTTLSVTLLTEKIARENDSPNIQRSEHENGCFYF